ncbi:phosphatidic acid-preferring phospholipase A1 [Aspergillus campestris IBT 28561]|uniref:Phosphatidic acid-preferring phospholipase A1 n=1 Tax=Aspergillus campestris (strain IBT 28561) TaxID=1392248 RepID=A0A2I1DBH9_ASPC2|nr:phosphatidic acid-preferring phospholipase A1 [Aspergillus campestris IBT 28561]PKY07236.1 phosphatidic acid-preferring phospholipase A1 [Aspergillus campestris IBT 28561]
MAGPIHTYGPTCLLREDDPEPSAWYAQDTPPKVRAQFFYNSSLPIDDPLSSLPPPAADPEDEDGPPQPFSVKDNIALEEAWLSAHEAAKQKASGITECQESPQSKRNSVLSIPEQTPVLETGHSKPARDHAGSLVGGRRSSTSAPARSLDHDAPIRPRTHQGTGSVESGSGQYLEGLHTRASLDRNVGEIDKAGSINPRKRDQSPTGNRHANRRHVSESPKRDDTAIEVPDSSSPRGYRSREASISGSPFARTGFTQPQSPLGRSVESASSKDDVQASRSEHHTRSHSHSAPKPSGLRTSVHLERSPDGPLEEEESDGPSENQIPQFQIPVGVSRLHLVQLPDLKMKPIYWRPLHDISNVVRSTWFYKNTMLPVETELANKLEDGYVYLKPWTETWQDELNSCVENGADAEMKVMHRLWPKDITRPQSRATSSPEPGASGSAASVADAEHSIEAALLDENRAAGGTTLHSSDTNPYINSSVIYVGGIHAQILRPSLLPSASRGRRPLSAIRKGRQIGIPVVRGFSRKLWDHLHPSKPSPVDVRNYLRGTQSRSMPRTSGRPVCYSCAIEESRPNPTDLVLVIHGIGQKLSERMESFHFTHAINAFRREINMELNSEPVWPHVRPGHGGIMVLPVNWRSTLSLEDASLEAHNVEDSTANHFTLKDITPETIPAVRSLISDVMLDIPYYLSHHKPKMIQAVVKEANRIYRLWCNNNPGFQEHGRIHLLAHSLGSVMAMDILSNQPTKIPHFDFSQPDIRSDIFEFDTKNLFLCGSPAGFFLLLNKANLMPRRGRDKPGSEGEDLFRGVAGEANKYGCLAVDNIYNIMHTTDPIAYRINGTVDNDLAHTLRPATIPSASSSFWTSLGSVFRWSTPSSPFHTSNSTNPARPGALRKMPTTVEMETHDFTREDIAEQRMLLLNDNGQIDYFLSGGGGPLNIQYLNMLSAHSSYWTLTDFVRFVVIEIARKQGREHALPAFAAVKKGGWKIHRGWGG